jgi:hypothetical protein
MPGTGPDLTVARWRKSSYSDGGGGDCVEAVVDVPGRVPVRDSKAPEGAALLFPSAAWSAFLAALKDG